MPICKCCNSWYDAGQEECQRCHTSVAEWEAERERMLRERLRDYFMSAWGICALAMTGLPFLVLVASLIDRFPSSIKAFFFGNESFIVPSQCLALFLSVIIVASIHARRLALREYELLRQVETVERPSLTKLAVIILGVLLILAGLTATLPFLPLEAIKVPFAFLFLVSYPIAIVAFVLFFMLLATTSFIGRLNERVPQPIYLRVNELIALVINSAKRRLGRDYLELVSMERTKQGGIRVTVKGEEEVMREEETREEKGKEKPITVKVSKRWEVKADKWGKLISIEELKR